MLMGKAGGTCTASTALLGELSCLPELVKTSTCSLCGCMEDAGCPVRSSMAKPQTFTAVCVQPDGNGLSALFLCEAVASGKS